MDLVSQLVRLGNVSVDWTEVFSFLMIVTVLLEVLL